MSILITGAKGQLGTELRVLLDQRGIEYLGTDTAQLDITDQEAVDVFFLHNKPTYVFHCAAYTAVDKAEDEGKAINQLVNVEGTENIARASEKVGATLIYISTDYVFDGTKQEGEYSELDQPNPQNEYGRAKYEGELAVQSICSNYYIVRTSWVFGVYGNNFVYTMERLAKTNPKLTIVDDQFGRPTWTRTLAEFMIHLMESQPEHGIYHLSNDNSCSWYEFAVEILKDSDVKVAPIRSSDFPQKAKRPQYSILDLSKTKATGFNIPTWQYGLAEFKEKVEEIKHD
ncbi:dTDP-4-dehydrorhamnose reductase [Vagococcus sp. BWB3-3]|uniref:dTDP-4-dehydrorhamnose reductase n=1 Tax=Vagococcus allomyrinae TaxID=2794353 RepID=A0A940P989_9ENTE|nr:dTDP-4-dehydrorhamnose reductase [Vagococcus allomyrinae]